MKRELPLTRAALGALASVLIVAIGGYFALVRPAGRDVTRLETQLRTLNAQVRGVAPGTGPVTDIERASWQQVEAQLRDRYIGPEDQFEVLVELAQLARASGMLVADVQLEGAANAATPQPAGSAAPGATFALPLPAGLTPNPGVIRLSVRHQYRALVDFLDRLPTTNTYVAVQGVDVRRVNDVLHSDIRLVSFRWVQAP